MRSELKFRQRTAGMVDTHTSISVQAPVSGSPAHINLRFIEANGQRLQRHVMYPTEAALLGARLIKFALNAAPGLSSFGFTPEVVTALTRAIQEAQQRGIERLEGK